MTRFIVGPDGTRYKVVPNALPDPQDYGHVEPVTEEPGPCVNCGSREQTVVCADCGRINPTEETP